MISIKSTYHVALNDIGLILQGSPESPAYVLEQATILNNRYAQGDRSYDDFAKWWYWAQTDWFQGIKDDVAWADDGKYYLSTNIDTWSEQGAIKLCRAPVLDNDFNEEIQCGAELEVDGVVKKYIGTKNYLSNLACVVYRDDGESGWTNILSDDIDEGQKYVSQLSARAGILWVSTIGSATSTGLDVVETFDGTDATDQTAYINSVTTTDIKSSRCHLDVGSTKYVFVDDYLNDYYALVKSSVANPAANEDWTLVFERTGDGLPISACEFEGNILYLVQHTFFLELRSYDIANSVDSLVRIFRNTAVNTWGVGDKYLHVFNGKLVITVPTKEIWEYDGSSMTRIYSKDEYKMSWENTTNYEATGYLKMGAVISDNKMWWGNLMYDGTNFHNTSKPYADAVSAVVYPLFTDVTDNIFLTDDADNTKLYSLNNINGSVYKGADNKNYIILNQLDKISGINKILFSATLIFKKLVSGQSIEVEYTIGELTPTTTWTSLGVISYTADGGSVTDKILFFPVNTACKKVWYRIKLEAGGSNTPVLYDIVTAYLPRPYTDKRWRMYIDCGDDIKLLNGSLENKPGRKIEGGLEKAWMTNQIVDFQDLNYAATAIDGTGCTDVTATITVDDTSEFPESGRIKIEDELIYYTGKTPTTYTGCARGQKGTKAVAHANDTVVHNGYKVIIEDFSAKVPILNNDKKIEYVVQLYLREII